MRPIRIRNNVAIRFANRLCVDFASASVVVVIQLTFACLCLHSQWHSIPPSPVAVSFVLMEKLFFFKQLSLDYKGQLTGKRPLCAACEHIRFMLM